MKTNTLMDKQNLIQQLLDQHDWTSWDDIENEIERIREDFDLVDCTSMWDEAWFKFEEIYLVNPIEVKDVFLKKP